MKKNINILGFGLTICLLLFLSSQIVFAQATTGTLRGRVLDPNGAVVPGATVTAKNEATGVSSPSFVTTDEGLFAITNLLPGTYSVTVAGTNFKTKTVSNISVRLGLDTDVKIDLEVGSAQETVTVVANAEEIAQTNSEVSTNFESRKVSELPSNAAGAGIDTLALNVPGVTPGFGNVNSNGTTLSVNGNRARSNNFSIDGTDNNDLSIGGPSYFVSNTELVQEFQIVTNNFSAQYGRNQGAIVNIVTKSGTNSFSGSAFLYHRNASSLDAMNNIERRTPTRSKRDKFISNTFGGTFGGPIIKNKAFFFGSYQGIQQAQNFTSRGTNPAILGSELSRLQAAFPGNAAIGAIVRQSAFALSNFGTVRVRPGTSTRVCISATPGTNCVVGTNETGLFAAAFPEREFAQPFEQNEFSVRGDWNATSKDNISVRYLWQDNVTINSLGGSNGFTGDVPARSKNLSGFYTRQLSSRIVNNFQATFQRLSIKFGGGCSDPLTGCIPDPLEIGEAYTNITFGGVTSAAGTALQGIGGATNLPQGRIVDVYQFSDKVAWTIGSHSLNFGVDFRFLKNSVPFLPNINGVVRFDTLADLVNNDPSSVTLADGQADLAYKQYDQFYFLQDDWRILPNLTLNLGVRYEYSGQPINRIAQVTNEREANATTALYRQNLPIEARTVPFIPSDTNNIAPRLGFAWSPEFGDSKFAKFLFGGKDKTVIRGGYSIAYDAVFYNIMLNISTSAPTVILDTFGTSIGLPNNPIGSAVRGAYSANLRRNTFDPRLLAQTDVSSDFHSPYSIQYSIGIQRQINDSNVFEIRYVGNKGKDLFQTVNSNPFYDNLYNGFTRTLTLGGVLQTITFPSFRNLLNGAPAPQSCTNDGTTPDNEGACNGRLLAGRGLIRSRTNTGSSQYDSMQARYNGRFLDKNLILGATYTWSKAIDNASEIFAFGESPMAQNPFDLQDGERGLSGFDRPHAFSMNFIYDFPMYKDQKGFIGKLLGGWQMNGTYNLASGRPYTPEQFRNSQVFENFRDIPGGPTQRFNYLDAGFANTFIGLDNLRPFLGNPNVDVRLVGITNIDARLSGRLSATAPLSPTGFYLLNDLNRGVFTPITPNDVRFIFNGPGAALAFGTPFGTVGRNSVRGKILNQMNMGLFKTTRIGEKLRVQFRAEAFNILNTPNSGFGVAGGASIPGLLTENAGVIGSAFGDNGDVALSSRRVQFGLRIVF